MFGAYDIRGVWGEDLNPSTIKILSYVFSNFFSTSTVGIGRDIRYSSDIIFNILCRFLDKDIYDYGIVSTPIMHYMSVVDNVDSLMITASHNPPKYNGIKPVKSGANDLTPEEIQSLKKMFEKYKTQQINNKGELSIENRFYRINEYFMFLQSTFEFKQRYKLAYDPANGTGFIYLDFLSNLFDVYSINNIPNGLFPAHSPDPSKEENIQQLLSVSKDKEFGLALDGDCDRIGFIYKGEWIKSDKLIYFISKNYLNPGDTVVLEVMLPFVLDTLLKDLGIKVLRVPTGHVNVKKYARENNAKVFGEYSGHFGFKEFYYIDDALFTFLKVVSLIDENGFDINEYPDIFQTRIDVPKEKVDLESFVSSFNPIETYTIDGYDMRFDNARVLIRESNTEPMYRIKIEALDKDTYEALLTKTNNLLK